ncbi:MAG: hypothetical protein HWD59_14780 [Coxiellaceae bacterium]|nr:MAG: hypothetical protein HWD59_14780 [Coxiellaceae bacterium]
MLKARSQYLTVTAFSRLYQHQISPLTALFPEFEFYANISQRQYFNGQFIDPAKTEMLWFKQSQELEMIRQAFQLQQNSIRPQDFQSAILNF